MPAWPAAELELALLTALWAVMAHLPKAMSSQGRWLALVLALCLVGRYPARFLLYQGFFRVKIGRASCRERVS